MLHEEHKSTTRAEHQRMKGTMPPLAVFATIWLTATTVSAIDCGCPNSCTSEALNEQNNNAPFRCGARIDFLMHRHKMPEANACASASDGKGPCRGEACHPDACGSTLSVVEDFQEPRNELHHCGCPETCTDEVMDQTLADKPFSCGARIGFMVFHHGNPEWGACEMAVDEGYCDRERCRPDVCNSTLEEKEFTVYQSPYHCGCKDTCTDEVMSMVMPGMPFSCEARINYMVTKHGNAQWDACTMASDEGYCDIDKCRPDKCGSTLEQPPPGGSEPANAPPPAPAVPQPPPPVAPETENPPSNGEQQPSTSSNAQDNKPSTSKGHGKGIFGNHNKETAPLSSAEVQNNPPKGGEDVWDEIEEEIEEEEEAHNKGNGAAKSSGAPAVVIILSSFLGGGVLTALLFFIKARRYSSLGGRQNTLHNIFYFNENETPGGLTEEGDQFELQYRDDPGHRSGPYRDNVRLSRADSLPALA